MTVDAHPKPPPRKASLTPGGTTVRWQGKPPGPNAGTEVVGMQR